MNYNTLNPEYIPPIEQKKNYCATYSLYVYFVVIISFSVLCISYLMDNLSVDCFEMKIKISLYVWLMIISISNIVVFIAVSIALPIMIKISYAAENYMAGLAILSAVIYIYYQVLQIVGFVEILFQTKCAVVDPVLYAFAIIQCVGCTLNFVSIVFPLKFYPTYGLPCSRNNTQSLNLPPELDEKYKLLSSSSE